MGQSEVPDAGRPVEWLLFVHQLPAKPAYLRVKVWRRLQALGAVGLKNSVYALPSGERTQEDFAWLLKEVVAGGGEGMIWEARLIDGLSEEDMRQLFNSARAVEYDAVGKAARSLAHTLGGRLDQVARAEAKARLKRLKGELARIFEIDFFGANGREAVAGLLQSIESQYGEQAAVANKEAAVDTKRSPLSDGRVWVTRVGVFVDRIASAWLIRRFIDPAAQFKFVPAKGYAPSAGELRFDMFEAEFTHVGDRCTFEVLLARTGSTDPALTAIAQIVHDIDVKDNKFGRDETRGVASLIEGIAAAEPDDGRRLARGAAVFDDLYAYFRKSASRK